MQRAINGNPRARLSYTMVFLKWALLVPANAVCGFTAALLTMHSSVADIVAMMLGIITFICLYSSTEIFATSKGLERFVRTLKTGAIVKMILQVIPGVELGAGFLAHFAVEGMGFKHRGFGRTYTETIVVGVILSLMVFLITMVIMYISNMIALRRARTAT